MARIQSRGRRGFTLIELLVVIAIIVALAALTMVIAPGALSRDRAATTATQLTGAMQISRARAMRDGLPRGIRLLVNNPNNISPLFATEFQYIESPPVFVPSFTTAAGAFTGGPPPANDPVNGAPWVEFTYTTVQPPSAQAGTITSRTCAFRKLTSDQATQIANAVSPTVPPTLSLPTLGTTHHIISVTPPAADGGPRLADGSSLFSLTVQLDQYPDGALGGQTSWRTYQFGVYGQPRALLGEPTYQLAQNTCVDLNLSSPAGNVATDYDILFGSGGQLVNTSSTNGAGQVFLMVRDPNPSKLTSELATPIPNFQVAPNFLQAGDIIIVVVKAKSGAVGAAPVNPDPAPAPNSNWYFFAAKEVSGQ